MTWQSEGKYLCLQVNRYTKSKKAIVTSFEIFNLEAKIVTTEILLMKDTVKLFAWEPNGSRFGVIHGEADSPIVNVSFYQIGKKKLEHKNTLEKRAAQRLFWSPRGSYLVIGGKNGSLEFYNAAMNETMSESDHYMVSALKWDPTGRYVCTYVSAWKMQVSNQSQSCNILIHLSSWKTDTLSAPSKVMLSIKYSRINFMISSGGQDLQPC